MIDYAKVKALENIDTTKTNEVSRVGVFVHPSYIIFSGIFVLLVYIVAWQNITIARTKHQINYKVEQLHKLMLEKQQLDKYKMTVFSSAHLINEGNINWAEDNQIEIIH